MPSPSLIPGAAEATEIGEMTNDGLSILFKLFLADRNKL
jgi:hypothetical protein